jgi:hypothetical protein
MIVESRDTMWPQAARAILAGLIVTLSEGEVTELHVGLKGTMNAHFLKDLAAKTHRGIRGRVLPRVRRWH